MLLSNIIIYAIGFIGYGLLEIIWRGYTHWTMAVTGGFCLLALFHFYRVFSHVPLWLKCLSGALIITGIEYAVGIIVNVHLKWNAWDYSRFKYNISGQICMLYTFLWTLLCIPVSKFCTFLNSELSSIL